MRPERPFPRDLPEPPEATGPVGGEATGTALHVCEECASAFVQPVDGERVGAAQWRIALWCPECDRVRLGVFDHDSIAQLDDELDRATAELLETLVRVAEQNRREEIARFATALEDDLILPEDF